MNPSQIRNNINNSRKQYKTVVNLSNYTLNEAENKLLDKGLRFIPSIKKIKMDEILNSKERLIRSLKIKDFFKDKPSNNIKKPFQFQSTWTPPWSKLSGDTMETIHRINLETNQLLQCIPGTTDGSLILPGQSNLDAYEKEALDSLKNNKEIIIKSADKGGAIVILDKPAYIIEANRQLNNSKYYRRLDHPIYHKNIDKINDIVKGLLNKGYINEKQFKYLSADTNNVRPRIFYLLPKIHKKAESWPQPGKMPEGRPIVSDCASESYNISEYLDSFIAPHSVKHPAYLKNTYDFINKVQNQTVHKNSILVTGDVSSLYTNMNLDRILMIVKDTFEKFPDDKRPDKELLKLLDITLKNNDFEFNGTFFLQIHGTAMGKKYAPSLANLYLQYFDHMAMTGFKIKPILYKRFLDDIFFVWPSTMADLEEYNKYLNSLIPDIKLTFSPDDNQVNFLDTTVYKNTIDNKTTLLTKVYFKETDTHQLLHTESFHPKHTTNGILKSQLLRFKRISSTYENYSEACYILFNALKDRGYSSSKLRKMKRDVWQINNDIVITENNKIIPIILKYNQLGYKFVNLWKNIIKDNNSFDNFKLIAAYSNNKNLASHLVRSNLINKTFNPKQTNNEISKISGSFSLCNAKRCTCCRFHTKQTNIFKSEAYNRTFSINQILNCKSTSVIYLITCRKCKLQYVGETKRSIQARLLEHRSNINTFKNQPISNHFNTANHTVNDLEIIAIEQVTSDKKTTIIRRQREQYWQNKIGSKYPLGLNEQHD